MAKMLVTPSNLLLLDEPTHHLDMESCDALLTAIDDYGGTVIIVTHNEMFLHALAERLVVFENGTVDVFEGSYQRFLEKRGWKDEALPMASRPLKSEDAHSGSKTTKKELRRKRSEIIRERGRALKPLENRMRTIENEIEVQEKALASLNDAMQEASLNQNGAKIAEISQAIHRCQSIIDQGFDALETIAHSRDAQQAVFDKQLAELDDIESP
jgi:ATP-binding cassette subfamily F protein 3